MKMINIEEEKLKRIIKDLEKASITFDGFGCDFWHVLTESEAKRYGEAEVNLTVCIEKLKNARKHKKKTV